MDIIVGLLAIFAGFVFCFRGYLLMRLVIPVWGFFAGFAAGAGFIAGLTDRPFLGTVFGWTLGMFLGLLFAFLAYTYYAVAIVLAMASVGYLLGAALMVALGIDWNWLIVVVGVVFGLLLAMFSIRSRLPAVLLTVFTAMGGATAIIGGLLLVFNTIDTEQLGEGTVTSTIDASWAWWIVYFVLAMAGIGAQVAMTQQMQADVREAWGQQAAA